MTRRLLVSCTAFAPSLLIGGRRCEAAVRRFAARGWDVTVVAPEAELMPPVDRALAPPADCEVIYCRGWMPRALARRALARLRSGPGAGGAVAPAASGAPTAARGLARWIADAALAPLEFPDDFAGWIPRAVAAVRGRRFDAVLASLPAFSAALAGRRIADASAARLVLDYRDPWTDILERKPADERRGRVSRHRRAESHCLARADLVVAATPTIARWLEPRCARPPLVVPTGFEAAAAPARPGSAPGVGGGDVRLVHAGSLSYGRTLEPLLAAMARAGSQPARRVRLDQVGSAGDGERVIAWAERAGVRERVRVRGPVSHAEASAAVRGADAAIVIVSRDFAYAVPGKLWEILREAAPILLIAPEGCDAQRLVREHALGWSHAEADVEGIAHSLAAIAAGRVPEPVRLEELATARTMDRLERAVREVLTASPEAA